jgi:uncharacterized protein
MTIRGALAPTIAYLTTFGWAFAAFLAGQAAALVALLVWWHGDLGALYAAQYDGAVVTLSVLVLNPVMIAVIVLAVRLRRAELADCLGLVWPQRWALAAGLVGIVVIIGLTDAILYVTGRAIVSPFQTMSYTSAAAEGWLPLMWIATVIVAPAGEEIVYRGFLFRGFAGPQPSARAAWPAIVFVSLLWAGPHLQYDWTGIGEIFVAGLFLGWVRWRSGSTLLTFLLHGLFNFEGMLETVAEVRHLF